MTRRICYWSFFDMEYRERLVWVRFLGYGIYVKDTTKHPELFSERNNYSTVFRFGRFLLGFLTPR